MRNPETLRENLESVEFSRSGKFSFVSKDNDIPKLFRYGQQQSPAP